RHTRCYRDCSSDVCSSDLERMADATMTENVTSISGVPTWTLVLAKRMLERSGKKNLLEIWPNLELFVHGAVSFTPYQRQFENLRSEERRVGKECRSDGAKE